MLSWEKGGVTMENILWVRSYQSIKGPKDGLDEVNRAFAELETRQEPRDLAESCRVLSCLISGIARREKPLYYNIL